MRVEVVSVWLTTINHHVQSELGEEQVRMHGLESGEMIQSTFLGFGIVVTTINVYNGRDVPFPAAGNVQEPSELGVIKIEMRRKSDLFEVNLQVCIIKQERADIKAGAI
mmetsp:Transcript_112283/g.324334  ORF Transcript_112283/g.324334 Transcript_112283/m.324334 type:complete len:109 (-) Transcript_112283:395-721(-)